MKGISIIIVCVILSLSVCGCSSNEELKSPPQNIPDHADIGAYDADDKKTNLSPQDIPAYTNIGAYDAEMILVQPSVQGPPETYEELMSEQDINDRIDSLYKIEITEIIAQDEAKKLTGWSLSHGDQNCVFYRGIKEYDYLRQENSDESIIFRMPGTLQAQREGQPPYTVGDVIAAVTLQNEADSDITRLFKSYAFIYDIYVIDGDEYAFVRGQNVPEIEEQLLNYSTEETMSIPTSTTDNPVIYRGAFLIKDIANSLNSLWKTE